MNDDTARRIAYHDSVCFPNCGDDISTYPTPPNDWSPYDLTESIARALYVEACEEEDGGLTWETEESVTEEIEGWERFAAAVLPIVAEEVRKAKEEVLREVVEKRAITIPDALGYKVPAVTVEDLLDAADAHETGDQR